MAAIISAIHMHGAHAAKERKMRYSMASEAYLQKHGLILKDGKPVDLRRSSTASIEHDGDVKKVDVKKNGVTLNIFANWIKNELDSEISCLELPFTIIVLVSFACLAIAHLRQDTIMKVEDAVETDIIENANFAWAHAFGHKGIYDVNSYADFWSWSRLGLFPLLVSERPWWYSEGLDTAVPPEPGRPAYDVDALPSPRQFDGYRQAVPIKNDYLRYTRIIGGFRYRQQARLADPAFCKFPGAERETFERWMNKGCTGLTENEIIADAYLAESLPNPTRVEWFYTEKEDVNTLLQHIVDMEDGCASATSQNRTCLCEWCAQQPSLAPWLDEGTERVEISFLLYNAQYGLYSMAGVNFFFNRAGFISKLVHMRSAWAGVETRSTEDFVIIIIADIVWICSIMNVLRAELVELIGLIRSKNKRWYETISDDYMGFWNLIDWISIILAVAIMVTFAFMMVATSQVNNLLGQVIVGDARDPNRSELMQVLYAAAENMFLAEKDFRFWLTVYPLVLMLRLFKSFAAQARLAIVTDTFQVAKTDIMHFSIVFLSVWFCFSMNAVLFFGQDVYDFTTIDRAMLASFRAMLGDWDWDNMLDIGLTRSFLWFSMFMLVMVLLLLNMLLAILMESYLTVKDAALDAATLAEQMKTMARRAKETRQRKRVRLNEIWDALLQQEDGDDEKMLSNNDKLIFPDHLEDIVPGIEKKQAERTLNSAQTEFNRKNDPPFSVEDLQSPLEALERRVADSAKCAVWLTTMMDEYKRQNPEVINEPLTDEVGRLLSNGGKDGNVSPTSPGARNSMFNIEETLELHAKLDEDHLGIDEQLTRTRQMAEEGVEALAEDIGSVMAEEMQSIERRQKEQQASMEQINAALLGVRTLIYKLHQTCAEISQTVASGGAEASAFAIASGGGPGRRSRSASKLSVGGGPRAIEN
eukprot:TRINITY_DN24510_c0_g1_i1.p1 TRINITY_DN24510_c0_g1~~TRINITY_DN24510_c0_g1_i1.p1  ORF type:complete len:927 (-),score=195.22 TRINITY_DN24510_c0_g1_i1:129-2909(-)